MSSNSINDKLNTTQNESVTYETDVDLIMANLPANIDEETLPNDSSRDIDNSETVPEKDNKPKDKNTKKKTKGGTKSSSKIPYKTIVAIIASLGVMGLVYKNIHLIISETSKEGYSFPTFELSKQDKLIPPPKLIQQSFVTKSQLLSLAASLREDSEAYTRSLINSTLLPLNEKLSGFSSKLEELSDKQYMLYQEFSELPTETSGGILEYKEEMDSLKRKSLALNSELKALIEETESTAKLANALKDNEWGIHKRLKKVEKLFDTGITTANKLPNTEITAKKASEKSQTKKIKTKAIPSAQKVTWNNKHPWKLKLTSTHITQILNVQTNQLLRIYDGVEVRGCGLVTNINVEAREVSTQHCKITRSSHY
jgi:hypothetical protein